MPKAAYALEYSPDVVAQIKALPREIQRSVVKRLGELTDDPRPRGLEKLEDDGGYRVFFLGVRVTYAIDDANSSVYIVRVAPELPDA